MLVFFERIPRIQLAPTVFVVDREIVANPEVDPSCVVAGSILNGNLLITDYVKFPVVAVPYGPHLLDILNGYIRACLVFNEDEI
jgi:hypothetical protein